ncbi:hypothetical protein C8T65DRAFT_155716 [Cerioporus squamosus]|nr:hypothetical protein C8T65DRAFT_155716 [Cerioporus squamosus]
MCAASYKYNGLVRRRSPSSPLPSLSFTSPLRLALPSHSASSYSSSTTPLITNTFTSVIMSYPKSCLKRGSVSSTSSSDADSVANTSPRQPYFLPNSVLVESCASIVSASTSSSSLPPNDPSGSRPRRKSVTFCEDDDIRVFYPPRTPLHKQAKRAASRLFRVCADALRIEPYDFPSEEDYMQEYSPSSPESPVFLDSFAHVHIDEMHAASPR